MIIRKRYNFTLSDIEKEIAEHYGENSHFKSESEFIGTLLRNYAYSTDPIKELEQIKEEMQENQNKLIELQEKETIVIERMKAHKRFEEERKEMEVKAIDNVKRLIIEGKDKLTIENAAKFWGFRLNKDPVELMYKAYDLIKNQTIFI